MQDSIRSSFLDLGNDPRKENFFVQLRYFTLSTIFKFLIFQLLKTFSRHLVLKSGKSGKEDNIFVHAKTNFFKNFLQLRKIIIFYL